MCCPALVLAISVSVQAEVSHIEIVERLSPAYDGLIFGDVGQYEQLRGKVHFRVDINDPVNRRVVNVDKVPRDEAGLVRFSADFTILKPINTQAGNGILLHETINRSRGIALRYFNSATTASVEAAEGAGNGFLMQQGYTIAAVGWQASYPVSDAPPLKVNLASRLPVKSPAQRVADIPVARYPGGVPIVDWAREEVIGQMVNTPSGAGELEMFLTYPAASLEKRNGYLTARLHEDDFDRQLVDSWNFVDEYRISFPKPEGHDAGHIYEFVYLAREPLVYGLGYVAMRDFVSFLRNQNADSLGTANPLNVEGKPRVQSTINFGVSQTGRVVKTFVHEGFNEDEEGRQVFDGVMTHVGGSRRNALNTEFSHPGTLSGDENFPFSYARLEDHITGETASLLDSCRMSGTCPKIFHTDTETEVWGATSSLVSMDTQGTMDVELPSNVRAYLIAGSMHGPGQRDPQGLAPFCQQMDNPLDYTPLMRAFLVNMERWLEEGIEPPASQFPRLSDGAWVKAGNVNFPVIPSARFRGEILPAVDHLPEPIGAYARNYDSPYPQILGAYPRYVVAVDEDGNSVAGIRQPEISVPLGTHTGWNLSAPEFGGDRRLCSAGGSFIPFAQTRAERVESGDPRLSLEERYPTLEHYVDAVRKAVEELAELGFLLKEDAEAFVERAEQAQLQW